MIINRGDIYWVPVLDDTGEIRKIIHPQVVIQDSIINQSRIDTIVVCGLSTNMKKICFQLKRSPASRSRIQNCSFPR